MSGKHDRPTWWPEPKEGRGITSTAAWVIIACVAMAIAGVLALGFIVGPQNDAPRDGIDPKTCEFVLAPHRDNTFYRCPVPKEQRIPNWPDKQAPLNGGK